MADRVLVVDDVHESLVTGLKTHGFEVFYEENIESGAVLTRAIELKVEGIVVRSKLFFSGEFLHACNTLKWIARAGVGTDNIDMNTAHQLGIKVLNADGANALTVAEHVLGMILGFLHKLPAADAHVREGKWDRNAFRGRELSSLKVGIVGMGNTGSALAGLFKGFQVEVLGYDKYKSGFAHDYIKEANCLDAIWQTCDIISFHVPLTEETQGMINAHYLVENGLKPLIINASRGAVLEVASMVNSLKMGLISGLILDVWPDEPPTKAFALYRSDFDWLKTQTRVMFSPHVAGWSYESYERISLKLLDNVLKFKGCV
jgi:D-3-phosphoglycerate dehydrogenase